MRKKLLFLLLVMVLFNVTVISSKAQYEIHPQSQITSSFETADFSADGKSILVNSGWHNNYNVEIWNTTTGVKINTLESSLDYPVAKYLKDKILIAGHSSSHVIRLNEYNIKTGKLTKQLIEIPFDNNYGNLLDVIYDVDRGVAFLLVERALFKVNLNSGSLEETFKLSQEAKSFSYNTQNQNLTIAFSKNILVLDTLDNTYLKTITITDDGYHSITSVKYSYNNDELFVLLNEASPVVIDIKDNYKIKNIKFDEVDRAYASYLTFSENGEYMIFYSDIFYGKYQIYEVSSKKVLTTITDKSGASYAKFSNDGKKLLLANKIYDAMVLEENKIAAISIKSESTIIPISTYPNIEVYGITKGGKEVKVDSANINWTVEDEDVIEYGYGKLYALKSGITKLTAEYEGFEDSITVTVTKPFVDISKTSPNYEAIHYLKELGIINGYDDGTFKPNNNIPRHHIAAMIGRSNIPLPAVRAGKEFKDVPLKHSNYANIQKLYRAGILDGDGNMFSPTKNITHIQLAKILTNIFKLEKADNKSYQFNDIKSTHWGQPFAEIMVSNAVMPMTNNNFNASSQVTRGQFAQYLYNALKIEK